MKICTNLEDPQAALWADPEFVDLYLDAVVADYEDAGSGGGLDVPGIPEEPAQPSLIDELLQAEGAVQRARAATAEQDDLFQRVLARAASDPVPWVGPDPTDDPAWEHPAGWTRAAVRARRRSLAVRAAAADLAVRVQLSDNQVRLRAHRAQVLSTRCPATWQAYLSGAVSDQNAGVAVELASSLPDDAPAAWAEFDEQIADHATGLTPAVFRRHARAARERAHPEQLDARHARAAQQRSVEFSPGLDGMGTIVAYVPAVTVHAIEQRVEDYARHLGGQSDEKRTLDQLRADVFSDLLLTGTTDSTSDADTTDATGDADATVKTPANITSTVRVTIPALTLLGHSDEPATLDGYGPIDLETAQQLAGGADSWIRVLTHPVTGTVLDVDRKTYRVPADLRRLLGVRHPTCTFPGCCRPAHRCDIDHRTRWADGGTTTAENLDPKCESHHPLKDETLWAQRHDPVTGRLWWISPTGVVTDVEPPPF